MKTDDRVRLAEAPLALIEKVKGALRLSAVNREAALAGLSPGLTLADVRARIPTIRVFEHDPEADACMLERLAEDCERFSPVVMIDSPDGLLLDITGCAHLFDGEANLRTALCKRVRTLGFYVRATIAGTPDAARAISRFSRIPIVPPDHDMPETRRLPIAALGLPEKSRIALARAGLKTIGELADRPSLPLTARFGDDVTRQIRRMFGEEGSPLDPHRKEPSVMAEQRFAEPIAREEDIASSLDQLAGSVCQALLEQRTGGKLFEANFFRSDGVVRRIQVETARPARNPAAIMRLYRERLDSLADPLDPGFGFDIIRLSVLASETLASAQTSLDGHAVEEGEFGDLVERLSARLGRSCVLRFASRDTHDPGRVMQLVPAIEHTGPSGWIAPEPREPPARPLYMFAIPQPIETLAEVPDGAPKRFRWRRVLHDVVCADGPERIAPEWWRQNSGEQSRDYFRVEDSFGRRFWIFREGVYGRETDKPRWFMHGLFP